MAVFKVFRGAGVISCEIVRINSREVVINKRVRVTCEHSLLDLTKSDVCFFQLRILIERKKLVFIRILRFVSFLDNLVFPQNCHIFLKT